MKTAITILGLGLIASVLVFIGMSGPVMPAEPSEPTDVGQHCISGELWYTEHYSPITRSTLQSFCTCRDSRKLCVYDMKADKEELR